MNLVLLIIAAVFAPMAFASVEPWARTILELLIFGAAVATVTRERYIYLSRANKTLIPALLSVALIGLLQILTQHPVNAPAGSLPFTVWRPHTVDGIVLWCAYAAIVFAAAQAVEHKVQLKLVLWTIFLTGLSVAFMGIFQKTGNDIYIYGFRKLTDFGTPPFGPFINRDNAANYMITSALCGLGLFLAAFNKYDRFAGRGKQFDFFARQTLLALMLGITIYGIIFTGSRGGIHSFAAAVFIAATLAAVKFLRGKNRIYAFGAAALLGAGYIVFVLNSPGLMARTGSQFDNTVLVRLSMYKSGLAMLKDFPLWGTGLNSLMHAFPYYQDFIAVPGTVEHAHSDWLELVLTVGLAGALAFLAGFAAFMYYAVQTALKSLSTEKSIIGICLIGAITAFCVHACVDFPLQIPANAVTLFLLLGMLASRCFEKTRRDFDDTRKIKTRSKKFAYALIPASLLLAALAIPSAMSDMAKLDAAGLDPAEKAAPLAKALDWQASPRAARSVALNYYNLAIRNPQDRKIHLNSGIKTALPFISAAPLNKPLNDTVNKTILFLKADRISPYISSPAPSDKPR